MMDQFSVVLLDPDRLFREGLKRILAESAYNIVGDARSISEASALLGRLDAVDLVAVDIADWQAEENSRFFEEARARGAKIVVLSSNRSNDAIGTALSCAVDAYLLKDMSPEALIRSLQLVMLGQQIFPTGLMMSLLQAQAVKQQAPESLAGASKGLSPREVQILRHLMTGHSNKAIARALDISEATVKVHLKALLRKVRVSNRTQAAIWAMNNGLDRIGGEVEGAVA
jgi:two-component system nitrate/nitrite response regulator NarL